MAPNVLQTLKQHRLNRHAISDSTDFNISLTVSAKLTTFIQNLYLQIRHNSIYTYFKQPPGTRCHWMTSPTPRAFGQSHLPIILREGGAGVVYITVFPRTRISVVLLPSRESG